MRTTIFALLGIFMFGTAAYADPPVSSMSVECNWGKLSMELIVNQNFPQGPHSSDPSGDGVGNGPTDADQPRAGLANVLETGNLQATCEFIESLLFP